MDIIFSHETALQICGQLKIHGNDEVLSQRSSRDFRATYAACSDETYEEKLQFLKKEYGIVLAKTTHEILRDNLRTRNCDNEYLTNSNAFYLLVRLLSLDKMCIVSRLL